MRYMINFNQIPFEQGLKYAFLGLPLGQDNIRNK